jgi:hypothetical protein
MQRLIIVLCLVFYYFPLQAQTKEFLKEGYIYGHIGGGGQMALTQKKLDPIADKMRNAGNTAFQFDFPQLSINLFGPFHFFTGFQFHSYQNVQSDIYTYLNENYPNQNIVQYKGGGSLLSSYGYFGFGVHKKFKKLTLLPQLLYGIKSMPLQHHQFLVTPESNNLANSYFLDFTDTSMRNTDKIRFNVVRLNTRILLNNSGGPLSLYVEPGLNYSRTNLDIIMKEREEATGISKVKNFDYRTGNFNFSFVMGLSMRLLKVKI